MSGNCGHKHTPIVSGQERKLFGYWKSNPSARPSSITAKEVESHLNESRGKNLPKRVRGSGIFSKEDLMKGYKDVGHNLSGLEKKSICGSGKFTTEDVARGYKPVEEKKPQKRPWEELPFVGDTLRGLREMKERIEKGVSTKPFLGDIEPEEK